MKKYIILFTALCSFLQTQTVDYRKMDSNDILRTLTGAHTSAFSSEDLFAKTLDQNDLTKWNDAINLINHYVEENSKNIIGIQDKTLIDTLTLLSQLNFELVKNIKKVHSFKNNVETLNDCSNAFRSIKEEAQHIQRLTGLMNYENKNRQNAKIVLERLALTIKATASTAFMQLQKYLL